MKQYLQICGIIAAGKSTFAKQFATSCGWELAPEEASLNPFLVDFYSDTDKYSFETEVVFLMQHYHTLKKWLQIAGKVITDNSMLLDRAYSDVTLTGKRHELFNLLADELEQELGSPKSIIYIKCSPKTALERIKARRVAVEQSISLAYLEALDSAISRQIEAMGKCQGKIVNVITVDSEIIDFRNQIPSDIIDGLERRAGTTSTNSDMKTATSAPLND